MTAPFRLAVEVWGARGSMPSADAAKLRYGGNTTCISVRSASGDRVIIDAGTGIRHLGRLFPRGSEPSQVDLFFTHFHWDHIQGLPYFSPLFQPASLIRFHSGVSAHETRAHLERQMSYPYFPVEFAAAKAQREFLQMATAPVSVGSLSVSAFPLNHPQGAWGYRIEGGGAAVVVATDMEHGHPTLDKVLLEYAAHADLLIYDAHYTEAEYATHRGWGHSHPRQGTAFAAAAHAKQLSLFHHHPDHDDLTMDQILLETRAWFPATIAAQERSTITL
jgi:phosphoribosyl 1,2-cyclic phosphodiesterase